MSSVVTLVSYLAKRVSPILRFTFAPSAGKVHKSNASAGDGLRRAGQPLRFGLGLRLRLGNSLNTRTTT